VIISRKQAEAAAVTLGIGLAGLTESDVQAAYRGRARETHPDVTGDAAAFVEVDRSKHVLINWLQRQPDAAPHPLVGGCSGCDGTGFVRMRGASFGSSLRRQCGKCKGTGDTNYEHEKGSGD